MSSSAWAALRLAPYTEDEDATTTWGPPCRRAASSTIMVPVALTSWVATGSWQRARHRGAGGQVDDRLGAPAIAASRSSDRQNGAFDELDRRRTVEVLPSTGREVVESHHARSTNLSASIRHRLAPMKPAPPVTTTFTGR